MDGENTPLIGAHGYCSQEMVNLLLTGRAVSNTFDGSIKLSENGISRSSDVEKRLGLLSNYFSIPCFIYPPFLHQPIWGFFTKYNGKSSWEGDSQAHYKFAQPPRKESCHCVNKKISQCATYWLKGAKNVPNWCMHSFCDEDSCKLMHIWLQRWMMEKGRFKHLT